MREMLSLLETHAHSRDAVALSVTTNVLEMGRSTLKYCTLVVPLQLIGMVAVIFSSSSVLYIAV